MTTLEEKPIKYTVKSTGAFSSRVMSTSAYSKHKTEFGEDANHCIKCGVHLPVCVHFVYHKSVHREYEIRGKWTKPQLKIYCKPWARAHWEEFVSKGWE